MGDNKFFLKTVVNNNGAPQFGECASSSYAMLPLSEVYIKDLSGVAADHARAPWRCLYCRRTFNPKDEFCDGCGAPLPL